jgi:23S rRNA (uridine2552-2'-O)-methyltransferase
MLKRSFLFQNNPWIQNQATDRYVRLAAREGYIARSAYKLAQIDDKFKIFDKRKRSACIDLGAAPGSWSQVIRQRCSDESILFGVDRSPLSTALVGYRFIQGDFTDPGVLKKLNDALKAQNVAGNIDVIVSDMCPDRTGSGADRFQLADLDSKVLMFAKRELKVGGNLVMKMIGGTSYYEDVIDAAKRNFGEVRISKPDASRSKSDETFLVGISKLEKPREGILLNGAAPLRNGKTVGMMRESYRKQNTATMKDRFSSYDLDDWPGLTKFKMRK